MQRNDGDTFGIVRKWIAPEFERVTNEMRKFRDSSRAELPPTAAAALDRFCSQDWFIKQPELINVNLVSIAAIATFRSEFEYLIDDIEIEGRNRTEVAFEHLRRTVALDNEIGEKWIEAFKKHEPACESLGAIHLLSHGIFAFKITSKGSATDLAFNEPVNDQSLIVRRSARAIVLTEWKLVRDGDKIRDKAEEARTQTFEYASGILGDTELKGTRYIVLVSEYQLTPPADLDAAGVKFRHINVAVDPQIPSRVARSRRR